MSFSLLVQNFSGLIVEMYVRIWIVVPFHHGSSPCLCVHTCLFLCQFSEETKVCFCEHYAPSVIYVEKSTFGACPIYPLIYYPQQIKHNLNCITMFQCIYFIL